MERKNQIPSLLPHDFKQILFTVGQQKFFERHGVEVKE